MAVAAAGSRIDVQSVDARGRALPLERLTPAERESVEGLRRALGEWAGGSPQGRVRIDCVSGRCTIIITWGKRNLE